MTSTEVDISKRWPFRSVPVMSVVPATAPTNRRFGNDIVARQSGTELTITLPGRTVHDHSIDPDVFAVILNGTNDTAAVHCSTASVVDLFEVPRSLQPASPIDLWDKFYRRPLEIDGLTSELDHETKRIPQSDTLDDFINVNQVSVELNAKRFHLIDTESYESKQNACSSIPDCSGWWRFSRIGYNAGRFEALVHTDYDHPKWGLMGMGNFVLLSRDGDRWLVVAKSMTWIS